MSHDPAADAAVALTVPAAAFWELAKIDPEVIDGVSAASAVIGGEHVVNDSYGAFLDFVRERGDALLADGNFNRLVGYVGEQRVSGLLEAQGEEVVGAVTANNPVWDLLVNGQAANVKTYQDAANALPYAREDPDTHHYFPEDATGQEPLDNVTYLNGFNAGEVRSSLRESIEAAQSLGDGTFVDDAALGIPIVLTVMTGYRQFVLVKEGKRLQDALLDGAFDIGARTVGAWAGLKAGVAAGATADVSAAGFTMGLGTAAGGMIGAAAGSKVGGWLVKEYRLGPIREAERKVFSALQDYGVALFDVGAQEMLGEAIYAPAKRVGQVGERLDNSVKSDRRSLRWWLWPGADQVLREAALDRATAEFEAEIEASDAHGAAWARILESEYGAASLGLVFANIPELSGKVADSDGHLRAVETAKRSADHARQDLKVRG